MTILQSIFAGLGWAMVGLSVVGVIYLLLAALATRAALGKARTISEGPSPDVTIVKPLNGALPGLREILEGFCQQNYPGKILSLIHI